jgi:hypothetical protein
VVRPTGHSDFWLLYFLDSHIPRQGKTILPWSTYRMVMISRLTLGLLLLAASASGDNYALGPDSQPDPGVPQGKVTRYEWNSSRVFPGTHRDYWV